MKHLYYTCSGKYKSRSQLTLSPLTTYHGYVSERKVPPEISRAAAALARRGASKGGKARAAKLTPERRQEIAKKAIRVRWEKYRQDREAASTEPTES